MFFFVRLWLISIISIVIFNQPLFASNTPSIDKALIKNGDFSEIDNNGNPVGWSCQCQFQSTTCDTKNDAASGGKILTLKPGCQLSSIHFPISNQKQGIRLDITTKLVPDQLQDISLIAYSNNVWKGYIPVETSHPASSIKLSDGFLLEAPSLSSDNMDTVSVVINNNHDKNIEIKKIDASESGENPISKSATLLEATHESVVKILPNSNVKDIWIPLPIDYASQVPLWINVKPTPEAVVHSMHYAEDEVGNWGVIVELNQHVSPGTEIHLRWDGIVLTKMIDESEHPFVYHAESDPSAWLQSTKTAESHYQPISEMAIKLTQNDPDLSKKISDISLWEAQNLKLPTDNENNDATTSFNDLRGNCTGFANLASAMGRSIQIPTRSIANYIVDGTSQSTHYINEFYLGPNVGWQRVEPQFGSSTPFPEDIYFIIHKDTPANEGEIAFNQGPWMTAGTPYLSAVANLNDPSANFMPLPAPHTFPDCPFVGCDNRAEHWLDLRSSHDEMNKLFEIARRNWQYDLHDYLKNGEINPKRKLIRDNVPSIQSTADLEKLLSELDQSR